MKKRIMSIGLALAALLLAVGLVGCPDTGGDDKKTSTKQSGAILEYVTIGTVTAAYPTSAQRKANVAEVLAAGFVTKDIPLTNSQASADIAYKLASSSDQATVEFARVPKTDWNGANFVFDPTDFAGDVDGYTFTDEDWLVAKVVSEDDSTTLYYRFNVTLGRNAYLDGITIGKNKQTSDTYLGEPGATFTEIVVGDFQTDALVGSYKFIPLAQDDGATVEYAFSTVAFTDVSVTLTTITSAGVNLNTIMSWLVDDNYLMIKVTPTSTQGIPLYYIVKLKVPREGSMAYGVPQLVNPTSPGDAFYIDPIWDTLQWDYLIDRANQAEAVEDYFKFNAGGTGRHTTARAKALFDDNGIWVLVDVDVSRFQKEASGALQDRPITATTDYNGDSVEIFINERFQALGTISNDDVGNQFRVGVNNVRTGQDAAAQSALGDAASSLAPFTDATYAKTRTVLKKPAGHGNTLPGNYAGNYDEATNGGYIVLAYAPFKFKTSTAATDVFETAGTVKDGARIGFELQLNTNSGSGRDGILTWNGFNTQAYQHAEGYGIVNLNKGSATPDTKVFPEITGQVLSDAQYLVGTTTGVADLSVTTTGNVQWYKATSLFGAGTAIASATNATFTPPTDATAEGISYYYAVVTENNVSVVTDRRARVEVAGKDTLADKWVITNPKFIAGWTTPDADGAVSVPTGGGGLWGYQFPVGDFYKVKITVTGTVTAGGGTTPLKLVSKQLDASGAPQNSADYTGSSAMRYMDITVPASGTFTHSMEYNVISQTTPPITGDNVALYNGGVAWQTNDNATTVSGLKITEVILYVDSDLSAATSFYLNLATAANVDFSTLWTGNFNGGTSAARSFADNTLSYTFTTDTNNQLAIIPLTNAQRAKLMATTATPITLTISGTATKGDDTDGSTAEFRWHLADPIPSGSWNASDGGAYAAFSTYLDGTRTATWTGNKSLATVSCIRLQINSGQPNPLTLDIKSVKISW